MQIDEEKMLHHYFSRRSEKENERCEAMNVR